jgi:hypothetical protein
MTTGNGPDSSLQEEKSYFWLTLVFICLLLLTLVLISIVVWNKPDYYIMYVPVPILEWAFVGSMVAVIYRLAYRKKVWTSRIGLYTWVIAKPIIGLFMGALVYFLALGGGKLLGAPSDALQGERVYWLSVVAFIGGFSDELSLGLVRRIVTNTLDHNSLREKDEHAL